MVEHHGSPEEQEARNRLLDQFLNRAEPSNPAGKLNERDEGDLAFAVAVDFSKNVVILRFGKPVDWLGFGAEHAAHLGNLLLEKARQLKEYELKAAADKLKS